MMIISVVALIFSIFFIAMSAIDFWEQWKTDKMAAFQDGLFFFAAICSAACAGHVIMEVLL